MSTASDAVHSTSHRRSPNALTPVVERLMAKDPGRRYQSAAELIADLNLLLQVLRQATSDEETRFVTPLHPARAADHTGATSIFHRLAGWLKGESRQP